MADALRPGLSPAEVVEAFTSACNKDANVLFITESWFAPFKARLLAALPPQLTEHVADALRDAIGKRRSLQTVVEFIEQQPMTWADYEKWKAERDRQEHLEMARAGYFPWEDVLACEQDEELQQRRRASWESSAPAMLRFPTGHERAPRSCPSCGTPASGLSWIYFSSPAWTWEKLCGRAGWLTICKPCHLQVEFFLEAMN